MATDPLTDAVLARTLLERATAWNSDPVLTTQEVTDLLALAASTDEDDATVYTGTDLNRSASLGWQWKAGKIASYMDIKLPEGMAFSREQIYEHCMTQAGLYAVGTLSVIGTSLPGRRVGIASIGMMTTTSADYWNERSA